MFLHLLNREKRLICFLRNISYVRWKKYGFSNVLFWLFRQFFKPKNRQFSDEGSCNTFTEIVNYCQHFPFEILFFSIFRCAGICRYQSRAGYCTVSLSQPLLKFRPRKDLVETLLHEMIHAYLFVASNDRDRESHGENFHLHMHRINGETGAKISVYHSFHDEVRHYKTHVWRCNGPCQHEKPYLGFVRRARNRAPSVNDLWWEAHKAKCNGEFVKIGEPEGFKARKRKVVGEEEKVEFQESWNSKGHVLGSTWSETHGYGSGRFSVQLDLK